MLEQKLYKSEPVSQQPSYRPSSQVSPIPSPSNLKQTYNSKSTRYQLLKQMEQ